MNSTIANKELVSYCGLYCGACKKYTKGSCPGCHEKTDAKWCKIRDCCIENNYLSCASCKEFANASECKKFTNFVSKIFEFIFRSDRIACLEMIKEKGYEKFAEEMADKKLVCMKK